MRRNPRLGVVNRSQSARGEYGRFTALSEEEEVEVVPRIRRLVLVSQHATQLDSSAPASASAALQFYLRSDTESVLSGPDVSRDAFGGSVDVEGEIWSVAGTEEVVSEVEAEVEVADMGRRPLQAVLLSHSF